MSLPSDSTSYSSASEELSATPCLSHPLSDLVDNLVAAGSRAGLDLSEEAESIRDKINEQLCKQSDIDYSNFEHAALLFSEEVECSICKNLLCEPITTPCGHTYCRSCLKDALSKANKTCPNCRAVCLIDASRHAEHILLASLLDKHFHLLYQQRLALAQAEKAKTQTLPVVLVNDEHFFPFTQMKFHLFEPRYRVMLKRILESGQMFAYVAKDHVRQQDRAVVAHVVDCQLFPDERACVVVHFGKRLQVEAAWQETRTFGLWYCEATTIQDANLTNDDCRNESLLQDYTDVKSAFNASREIFVPSSKFPKTEFDSEPTPPNWIIGLAQDESVVLDEDELREKSEQLSLWTFWAAGVVRQAYPDEFTEPKQIEILNSDNSCARLNLIANIVRDAHSSRRALPKLGGLFRGGNREGRNENGRQLSAVSRLRRLLQNRRANSPTGDNDRDESSSDDSSESP